MILGRIYGNRILDPLTGIGRKSPEQGALGSLLLAGTGDTAKWFENCTELYICRVLCTVFKQFSSILHAFLNYGPELRNFLVEIFSMK